MNKEQFSLRGCGGGTLAVTAWVPDGEITAVVQLVHGMREHMGRYSAFAEFLTCHGFVLAGHDQMGHGKSAADGTFGYFGAQGGAAALIGDCGAVTKQLEQRYPDKPLFLLGHSMGSYVTRLYILRAPRRFAGYICMGSGGERTGTSLALAFASGLSRLGMGQRPGKLLNSIAFAPYDKYFGSDAENTWLSRDPETVAAYNSDEFTRSIFTNAAFRDLLEIQLAATNPKWAGRVDKLLPILLVSGAQDPNGDFGKGIVQTYERLVLAGAKNIGCRLYENARHELLNELNREEVYYDLLRWMQGILAAK